MTDFDPWRSAEAAADVWMAAHGPTSGIASRRALRLQELLAHAREHVPLHARRLRGYKGELALTEWPVLHKAELMADFDASVADPALTRAAVLAHLADPQCLGQPLPGGIMAWESSGTSGVPGLFVQDASALAVYDAIQAVRRPPRDAQVLNDPPPPWAAFNPMSAVLGATLGAFWPQPLAERWAFVGVIDGPFASHTTVQRLRRLNPWLAPRLRSFSLLQPLPALVQALNDWAPTVLGSYPTAAAMLADEAAAGRLKLPLREVMTGGETLTAGVRRHMARQLGCPVHDSYGASECLTIANECSHGRLHLNADWVVLEPVDRRGRAVAPGTLSDGLLLTNLANRLQPLLRYAMDDRIRLPEAPCACGSPLPLLEVLGRHDDPLHLAGTGGAAVTLLPLALSTVLEEDAGVFDFQLRQLDARTLSLRLGAAASATPAVFERCTAALQAYAREQGITTMRVQAEPGQAPSRGRSGKVQRVVALPSVGSADSAPRGAQRPRRPPAVQRRAAQPRTQSTK
jgi:phenylacetate-coenzyme A ligase PaaK-like adenylate-forming protein